MAKTAVKFLRGHGRYNKGEIAGFEGKALRKLLAGDNPIAKLYDPKADVEQSAAGVVSDADLTAREAELARKAGDLEAREAALEAREKAVVAVAAGVTQAVSESAEKGNPPKRGGTKVAEKTGK